jgi:hypothetical protein
MGILSNLLGTREDYPPLSADSYANARLEEVADQLKGLIAETSERLEIVPSEHAAYVFIGKPPKKFGLAWIHDGRTSNFKTLVEEHGVNPIRLERITDHLREAYQQSESTQRYTTSIADRDIIVTPSETLEKEVHEIIDEVLKK